MNRLRRRLILASSALLFAPIAVVAQRPRKIPKVGHLLLSAPDPDSPLVVGFRERLSSLGYKEGHTILIETRWANDRQERLAMLAAELVHEAKVDVLVIAGCGKPMIEAARRASATIPLVSQLCGDLGGFSGEVSSFARPGGNTTGQTMFAPEITVKRLQFLKELVPGLSAVAVLWNPASEGWDPYWRALRPAAAELGIALHSVEVRDEAGLDAAFARIERAGVGALLTLLDDVVWIGRTRITGLALKLRLPDAHDLEQFAEAGGLLALAPDFLGMARGAAGQVDRILKGAKTGEIPIERATRFRLVLNQRTARELGLALPRSILARADRVIE